jgi:cell division protein FtsZ
MASPLLEAGAIDGARGILINITGSSGLKLSEVNEASTIIQNAAHEDCNIIFGAVQDERMGDEVKITVIATGFKQDMPARRERMLAESMTPGADYQVPIRGAQGRGGRPSDGPALFASEEREARQTGTFRAVEAAQQIPMPAAKSEPVAEAAPAVAEIRENGSLHASRIWISPEEIDDAGGWSDESDDDVVPEMESAAEMEEAGEMDDSEPRTNPELIPVAASVFDDDFFRASQLGGRAQAEPERVAAAVPAQAAGQEVRLFAGVSASHAEQAETDELDIPAFLRRSH